MEERNKKEFSSKKVYLKKKRLLDILLSFLGIILLLPIFFIIALAIKIDSKGSIFFVSTRIGKNGKPFKLLKFRTMLPNAEELIKTFSSEQIKEFKENFKLKNGDPRVTNVGNFLRKTSLDELPQLINVLKGELSIIGPRPIILEDLNKFHNNKTKFLSVTPGLTGYWVANRTSDTTYEQRILMELFYVDNISFKLDIKIFIKTIYIVIAQKNY